MIQQGNLTLPSEESVCPVCKQADPLLHQFRAGLNVCRRKRHHKVLSERAMVHANCGKCKGEVVAEALTGAALTWRGHLHVGSLKVIKHAHHHAVVFCKVQCPIMRGRSMRRTTSAPQSPQGTTRHGSLRSGSMQQGIRQ